MPPVPSAGGSAPHLYELFYRESCVGNDAPKNNGTPPFIPRSITERAMSLGGEVQVRLNKDGHDVVKVTIPLLAATRESQLALRA